MRPLAGAPQQQSTPANKLTGSNRVEPSGLPWDSVSLMSVCRWLSSVVVRFGCFGVFGATLIAILILDFSQAGTVFAFASATSPAFQHFHSVFSADTVAHNHSVQRTGFRRGFND